MTFILAFPIEVISLDFWHAFGFLSFLKIGLMDFHKN